MPGQRYPDNYQSALSRACKAFMQAGVAADDAGRAGDAAECAHLHKQTRFLLEDSVNRPKWRRPLAIDPELGTQEKLPTPDVPF